MLFRPDVGTLGYPYGFFAKFIYNAIPCLGEFIARPRGPFLFLLLFHWPHYFSGDSKAYSKSLGEVGGLLANDEEMVFEYSDPLFCNYPANSMSSYMWKYLFVIYAPIMTGKYEKQITRENRDTNTVK